MLDMSVGGLGWVGSLKMDPRTPLTKIQRLYRLPSNSSIFDLNKKT